MKLKHIAVMAGIVLILILTVQNLDMVRVDVLFWGFTFPLILLIYIALGLGFLAGYLLGGPAKRRDTGTVPPERRLKDDSRDWDDRG
ncbi:MAG: LapA family protein [Spirochaetes bacterium]|nr:LapA family protein [Spirochaetota bacterium]